MDRREELIQKLASQMDGYDYTQEQLEDMPNDELFRAWLEWHDIQGARTGMGYQVAQVKV